MYVSAAQNELENIVCMWCVIRYPSACIQFKRGTRAGNNLKQGNGI